MKKIVLNKLKYQFALLILLPILLIGNSCKKFVEIDPPITSFNGDNIYDNDQTAISALTALYINMSNGGNGDVSSLKGWLTNTFFLTGLTGDEFNLTAPNNVEQNQFLNNQISPINGGSWENVYKMIFIENSAIEKLTQSTKVTNRIKQQLLGEAKFMRAFCYFYLVNLYGDVPLIVSTDYTTNRLAPRASSDKIYQQITNDLLEAQSLLDSNYLGSDLKSVTNERIRPCKWAATALLARVYLYTGKWADAETQATSLIDNTTQYKLVNLNDVFLKNSNEAIFQLQPVGLPATLNANTGEGAVQKFIDAGSISYIPIYLTNSLVNSFDSRDLRSKDWIKNITISGVTYNYAYKYKIGKENLPTAEYSMVLRLGEQYLIRAEAKIEQGKTDAGIADLNTIRNRATDLTTSSANQLPQVPLGLTKENALLAVENERRFELFTEWGHRWFDLKRTKRADAVLRALKGNNWQTTDQLFPIPQADIALDPNLQGHQNPGYN